MPDNIIEIEIVGADKLMNALNQFPQTIKTNMKAAAVEAGTEIIETTGLKIYPPETAANKPPEPYYIRGVGMQYKSGNNMKSEKYGTKFFVREKGYGAVIGNTASYAQWLAGTKYQARHMAALGWRRLVDVAKEKLDKIKKIFQGWVDKTIKDLGL